LLEFGSKFQYLWTGMRIDPYRAESYNLCVPAALSFGADLLGLEVG
jgi:hypothetical protein